MKRLLKSLLILCVMAAGAFICVKAFDNKEPDEIEGETTPSIEETERKFAENVLRHMTLEQKVGQMIIIRNEYTEMTPEYEAEISEIQPGGYVLFSQNITTLSETKQLIDNTREKIESASPVTIENGETVKLPAIMSIDQEGGLVQRLQSISDYPPEYVPPIAEIGASGSIDLAYETGRLLAEECLSVGLNLDFAPVADIFSNPENTVIGNRAFGTDKYTVATMSTTLAKGMSDAGVVPVFKHFPGHGDTFADSHQSLPVVTKTLDELLQNELYPFQKAIDSGAEMIMVAHIALPNVTYDYTPASLSPTLINGVLKKQLKFDGLVITDGLDMGALTNSYSNDEIAIKAVEAGADLLLTPLSPIEAKNAILAAISDGSISEERINESVLKILEFKFKRLKPTSEEQ